VRKGRQRLGRDFIATVGIGGAAAGGNAAVGTGLAALRGCLLTGSKLFDQLSEAAA
jgi:hypothetical protein